MWVRATGGVRAPSFGRVPVDLPWLEERIACLPWRPQKAGDWRPNPLNSMRWQTQVILGGLAAPTRLKHGIDRADSPTPG
ncbi:hypothetical protein ACCO45_012278 [Purpureocillium lilacinum]|uniref:Uncharacterized protein n=1 Tax=Purpureocillium lilacinum TaxID=33203 RepID=A0ACC4DD93_PURLI